VERLPRSAAHVDGGEFGSLANGPETSVERGQRYRDVQSGRFGALGIEWIVEAVSQTYAQLACVRECHRPGVSNRVGSSLIKHSSASGGFAVTTTQCSLTPSPGFSQPLLDAVKGERVLRDVVNCQIEQQIRATPSLVNTVLTRIELFLLLRGTLG
jgi:hypothetical protein